MAKKSCVFIKQKYIFFKYKWLKNLKNNSVLNY